VLSRKQLREIARARLKDAETLLTAGRLDGAVYLCGYAVELALKASICRQLRWPGYPELSREFDRLQSFRTHDLDILLRLSGRERKVKDSCIDQWSVVLDWGPGLRYMPIGTATRSAARDLVDASRILLGAIA
jgi:HEPN domain-containing protein